MKWWLTGILLGLLMFVPYAGVVVLIGCAIWVGVDADKLRARSGGGDLVGNTKTWLWVVCLIVVGCVALSVYLHRRERFVAEHGF